MIIELMEKFALGVGVFLVFTCIAVPLIVNIYDSKNSIGPTIITPLIKVFLGTVVLFVVFFLMGHLTNKIIGIL